MRFSDIVEEEERKHQERLRLKALEEENKRLKKLLEQKENRYPFDVTSPGPDQRRF